jgi:hypothetical protein
VPIALVGRTDLHNAVFGMTGDRERSQRAIDAGLATGFRQLPPRPPTVASKPAGPGPKPSSRPKPVKPSMPPRVPIGTSAGKRAEDARLKAEAETARLQAKLEAERAARLKAEADAKEAAARVARLRAEAEAEASASLAKLKAERLAREASLAEAARKATAAVKARPKLAPAPVAPISPASKPAPQTTTQPARSEAQAWAALPAPVNPKLPQKVEHDRYIEARAEKWSESLAATSGTTPAAYRAEIQGKMQAAVDSGEMYSRIRSQTLPELLNSGRLKSQFETNTTGGALDKGSRLRVEASLMGVPGSASVAKRPIYGYVSTPGFSSGATYSETQVEQYGDAIIRYKPHMRDRATVTFSDSLAFNDRLVASPAGSVAFESIPVDSGVLENERVHVFDNPTPAENLRRMNYYFGYVEAQYHGGVTTEDIAEVAFRIHPPDAQTQALLKQKGIPWTIYRGDKK